MKQLAFLFMFVLCAASPSFAQATLVGQIGSGNGTGGGTTTTTAGLDTSTANFLACVMSFANAAGSSTHAITDSLSNTWHALTIQSTGGNVLNSQWFYAYNPTVGAAQTFTATTASSGFSGVECFAFSGMDTTSAVFDQESGAQGNVSSLQPGSLTPSNAGSVILTGVSGTFTSAPAVDSSFLQASTGYYLVLNSPANYGVGGAYKIQTSAAAVNPTWTINTTGMAVTMAVFKAASGCTPSKLAYTAQPSNAQLGAALGTISVSVEDSGNNVCTGDTSTVTLAKTGGSCTGMTLNGTVSGAAVAGVFTTTNVNMTVATGACTLDATDGALTSATSSSVTISCTPSKTVFTSQPSSALTGASLGTVTVAVQNSSSQTCPGDTSSVVLSKHTGATWGTLSSSSSLTKSATAGVASWTDLSINTAGSGSIDATDGALTVATSSSITISNPSYYGFNDLLMFIN